MLFTEELQEVRQMVTRQMETSGFVRSILFIVGSKSRIGYTCTSIPSDPDKASAAMRNLGKQLADEHPEVGKLFRAYFAMIGLFTFPSDERDSREVLLIYGVDTATNDQQVVVFEVVRDRTQRSLPFKTLQEFPSKVPIPQHPILQAFVDSYLSFA